LYLERAAQQHVDAFRDALRAERIVAQIHLLEVKLLKAGADDVQSPQSLVLRPASDHVADVSDSNA
jgi:hypothetical protein